MPINKFLYFGDFFAIPVLVGVFATLAYAALGLAAAPKFLLALLLGIFIWTLVEYWVHRYLYHHAPYLSPLHDLHHQRPGDFIGVPSFLSSGLVVAGGYLPLVMFDPVAAGGFTSGLLIGYAVYMVVHHATHHWDIRPGDWLYEARVRHMAHHYGDEANFGITTDLWDRVFGTARERRRGAQTGLR
jgi:sterol desaturase/sphingolipid hydroxylase (fatty acid hydroxylase superfamily)